VAIGEPPISSPLVVAGHMASWPRPWATWLSQAWAIIFAAQQSGVTGDRPTSNLWTGRPYFDTTLGYAIWWDGTEWVDATGAAA
jgi:hypothetical protein